MPKKDIIGIYLKATGQTFRELMGGGMAYGPTEIERIIREEALPQNKKIIWYYANDLNFKCDKLSFRLIPIRKTKKKKYVAYEKIGKQLTEKEKNALKKKWSSREKLTKQEEYLFIKYVLKRSAEEIDYYMRSWGNQQRREKRRAKIL